MSAFFKRLAKRKRTPLTVACILSAPLYFVSLLLASLAIDRPRIVAWTHHGRLIQHYHPTAAGVEAKIWLAALVPSLVLILFGAAAVFIRYGTYLVCAATVVIAAVLPHKLSTWQRHHILRYPRGQDLIPDKWSTNLLDRGEWEHSAHSTIISLQHWMFGLGIVFALGFALADELRRRRGNREAPSLGPPAVGTTDALRTGEGPSQLLGGGGAGVPGSPV